MCHLAAWVISNELKNPHGAVFKSWGRKVMRSRPDIEVTVSQTILLLRLICANTPDKAPL
jgi:hypothetical protein